MNIKQITEQLINCGIEKNEAEREVKMLLEHFCHYTELDRVKGKIIDEDSLCLLQQKIDLRIKTRMPVQYIIGEAYFMGEYFKVTPDVLIPRDETEILVRKAIQIINDKNIKAVLDIGTGSGCIACTIAKQTDAVVLGTDISSDALRIALDNVTRLKINNKAVFRKSDLFEKVRSDEKFGLIISNPPYIPFETTLSPEVMQEPSIALYAEENGLYFYRKIIEKALQYLLPNGYLMFELGINEAESVKYMLEKNFTNICVEKDFVGIDRIIYARLK